MGTLRKLKLKMKTDRDFRKTLVRGSRNEILIDIDGDKEADIALMDTTNDGDVDTIAVDLTGDGEFDLMVKDTDHNGIPDLILYDVNGDGELKEIASGMEVEAAVIDAINTVSTAIVMGDYVAQVLDERLDALDAEIRKARKELKKARI